MIGSTWFAVLAVFTFVTQVVIVATMVKGWRWTIAPLPEGGRPIEVVLPSVAVGPRAVQLGWDADAGEWADPVDGRRVKADGHPQKWRRL